MFNASPSDIRPGFYLEEVDGSGVAQPSMKLHKGNSAFSYARDIRTNVAMVFKTAQSLKATIDEFLKRSRVTLLVEPQGVNIASIAWSEVCKQVAALDSGVFPQELKSRFFRFSLLPDGMLRIRELDPDTTLACPDSASCHCIRVPDGMTNSIRPPYHPGNMPRLK